MCGEVIRGELRRHAAPAKGHARTDHRHRSARAPERAQHVWEHARHCQGDEHERDRQGLACVMGMARRGRECGTDHAEHDCRHGAVLIASRVLAEHALCKEEQHQQAGRQRRLHNDQRR